MLVGITEVTWASVTVVGKIVNLVMVVVMIVVFVEVITSVIVVEKTSVMALSVMVSTCWVQPLSK